jgi:ABC-type phosphate/phosphonate transport system substrate-binding protein/tRNA A-37 threonylcarbamoyl transferase component Bud32
MQTPGQTTDPRTCDICRTLIPTDAPLGQCPSCLIDGAQKFALGKEEELAPFGELPRRFGDYELLRQIGCGGMGIVYEARQMRLNRRVALKMIRPDLASKKFLRRFVIEGEAAARLDHPNIIPIYEIKEDGTESFFSMELVEGETLKEKIRKGELGLGKSRVAAERWREQAVAYLMADVARAVHHAHERGVFHRDLKPGNILLDTEGRPHIADFGVAKILYDAESVDAESTLTVVGAMLGTPEYMPPEQASGTHFGEAPALAAADIYSLGAILYELLTGRPPFRGNSHLETLQKVREGDLRRPRSLNPGIARDLETICLKCLEKNPHARYASADAVADDLDRWLEGKRILARAPSAAVRMRRWVKRNPVGAALIFSLCFGLGVSLGLVGVLADRMRTSEINKALERQTLVQKINDWWALPGITNIVIPASLLAEIREQKSRPVVADHDVVLKFGMSVDQDPITRAYSVASLLGELETRMGQQLGRNVFIDLYISKTTHLESELLSARQADFQRLDALSYVQAKAKDPGLVPVVIENDADEIVFCVLQSSGITNVAQLAGRSVGFGDRHSAVTVLAQYSLLTNRLRKADLKPLQYFTTLSVMSKTQLLQFGSAEIVTDMREVKGGREALRHLFLGDVDAAVTLKRYFETRRHRGTGLRALSKVPGVPEVFAARSGLDPAVVGAFRTAMLSLKESPGLGTLSSFRTVTGVIATNDSYFDDLRMALTNVQQRFESPLPSAADGSAAGPL